MLANHGTRESFGRTYLSPPRSLFFPPQHQVRGSTPKAIQKRRKSQSPRLLPPLTPSRQSASISSFPFDPELLNLKIEPSTPTMSNFGFSSSQEANYSYAPAFQIPVPQYTHSEINQYFIQYGCYPPQPYNVVPDLYPQPIAATSAAYQSVVSGAPFDVSQWPAQPEHLQLPTSRLASRSSSRGRKKWICDIAECTSTAQFTRKADLERHQATVHGFEMPSFPCTVPNCNRVGEKGFTRRDHQVEHLRNFHHMDIPKRRSGERTAFPFGYPEEFQNQDAEMASSASARGQRGLRPSRSVQRGRIVKRERRTSTRTTTSGHSLGAAGIVRRAIDQTINAPHQVRDPQPTTTEERDMQMTRAQPRLLSRSLSMASSTQELADALLSFGDPESDAQPPRPHTDATSPWDLP